MSETLDHVIQWIKNGADKRPPIVIFNAIKTLPEGVVMTIYIVCIIMMGSRKIMTFEDFKCYELIKLLITLPAVKIGTEMRIQKQWPDSYNPLIWNALKKYGAPPDQLYFDKNRNPNMWISKL